MKNVINYYYNLYPENIFQTSEEYYFFINNIRYSLIKYNEEISEINKIYNMHLDILNKKVYIHPIILNKDGKPLTFINKTPYILIQKIYQNKHLDIKNVLAFSNTAISESNEVNWAELWAKKNDYLEYQINMLGKKHPLIRESFSYYIGLGETAIQLVNMTDKTIVTNVYSHKRIEKDTDLYNPLNIKIDIKVRDAAEYFKQSFFEEKNIEKELIYFFKNTLLSTYEYIMFLARMIYPTYYFDLYEEIITGRDEDKKIISIINKTNNYEQIIKKIYQYYKQFINIPIIEWLE